MITRIEYLVTHPYEVKRSDIPLLKKEIEKYPYFYTLHALLLYSLKKENHPSFDDYLNKTSIHSSNRVDLYHYINSEQIVTKEATYFYSEQRTEITKPTFVNEYTESESIQDEINEEIVTQQITETKLEDGQEIEYINIFPTDTEKEFDQNNQTEVSKEKEEYNPTETLFLDNHTFVDVEPNINSNNDEIEESENTLSFSDWLKKFPNKKNDEKLIEQEKETKEREIKYKLIDSFLEKNPKIVPTKKTDNLVTSSPTNAVQNSEEYSDLMTETLAQIYIEQKKFDKAIKAYKILILKYPEKNSLFANRIKEIENLKNYK